MTNSEPIIIKRHGLHYRVVRERKTIRGFREFLVQQIVVNDVVLPKLLYLTDYRQNEKI